MSRYPGIRVSALPCWLEWIRSCYWIAMSSYRVVWPRRETVELSVRLCVWVSLPKGSQWQDLQR